MIFLRQNAHSRVAVLRPGYAEPARDGGDDSARSSARPVLLQIARWRFPTALELESILDRTTESSLPTRTPSL